MQGRLTKDGPGMLDDIWETPAVLRRMLDKYLGGTPTAIDLPNLKKPLPESSQFAGRSPLEVMKSCTIADGKFANKFTIIGAGTSFHAAILAEYLIETIARIPVEAQYASEFRYSTPLAQKGDIFVVVSNSGETSDAVESLRRVRSSKNGKDVFIVSIVNEANSTIAHESDFIIEAMAGVEAGVAATKAFSATVMAFVLLSIALGEASGTLAQTERDMLLVKLKELPDQVQQVLDRESTPLKRKDSVESLKIGDCNLWDIGCQNVLAQNFIFMGRGLMFPIALEGAMKCKEISYIHAEGYPAAEMKHGPIALIDQFMPVVCIAPRSDPTYEKIKANIEEVKTRNGSIIAITEDFNDELQDLSEHVIFVPPTHEYLMPLLAVIPLQLLAYMMGVLRGNEVDNPRGLQKIVDPTLNRTQSKQFAPPGRTVEAVAA